MVARALKPWMMRSEMAPPQLRGRLNQLFQIILTFAIFAAQVRLTFWITASHTHPA